MKQVKRVAGKILCELEFHKWESYRIVNSEDLTDLQPEEGAPVSRCSRDKCQVSKDSIFLH